MAKWKIAWDIMIVLQTATWKFLPNTRIFVSPFMWPSFGNILNTIGVKFWNVPLHVTFSVSLDNGATFQGTGIVFSYLHANISHHFTGTDIFGK
jgi:hypothetical protein